jgi:hypothetical protein
VNYPIENTLLGGFWKLVSFLGLIFYFDLFVVDRLGKFVPECATLWRGCG